MKRTRLSTSLKHVETTTAELDRRLAELHRRTAEWGLNDKQKQVMQESLQDLNTALEELHVTQEELHVQNEQLATAHEQIAAERQRYQELFEFAPDAYLVTDERGMIRQANLFATMLFNLPRELLEHKPMVTFVEPSDRTRFLSELSAQAKASAVRHSTWRMRARRQKPFDAEVAASVFKNRDGKIVSVRWLIRDVTRITQAARQLREYQERLRLLTSELSLAEERQRRRIAVEIHDRISQTLAMAKLKVETLRQRAMKANQPVIDEIKAMLEQTLDDTRSLTFELSPPVLYELGLAAAVEWLAEQVHRRHGLRVSVEDGLAEGPLPEDVKVLLFQAVRELLTNVVKYAKAQAARVSLRRVDSSLRVTVADDGTGFDPQSVQHPGPEQAGFGLFSIRTRLQQIGGRCEIASAVGEGTKVTLIAPLRDTSPKDGDKS